MKERLIFIFNVVYLPIFLFLTIHLIELFQVFFSPPQLCSKNENNKRSIRVLKDGGQFHVADWGKSTNRLMRFLFYSIQILDGFNTTTDNINGRLPEIFKNVVLNLL